MSESTNIYILNKNFEMIDVVDVFESFIWTDRFVQYGDFEIYTSASTDAMNKFKIDYYICQDNSEHSMIIEGQETETDVEDGLHLKVTGRSLESILDRRVIWLETILSGNFQDAIYKLLDENIMNPTDENRKISNFTFEYSENEEITALTIDSQITGDTLYDAINSLCVDKEVGFKIILKDGIFVFSLYKGEDRSYSQETNPYVVFSPNFENIINSNYVENVSTYKTIALIAGEGESIARTTAVAGDETITGLDRKELYVDARDLSSDNTTAANYKEQLIQRGNEKLSENKTTKNFDGQVETTQMYKFGKDFFIGDICQIENEFGKEYKAKIIEYIYSIDTGGELNYPTFEIVDDE